MLSRIVARTGGLLEDDADVRAHRVLRELAHGAPSIVTRPLRVREAQQQGGHRDLARPVGPTSATESPCGSSGRGREDRLVAVAEADLVEGDLARRGHRQVASGGSSTTVGSASGSSMRRRPPADCSSAGKPVVISVTQPVMFANSAKAAASVPTVIVPSSARWAP